MKAALLRAAGVALAVYAASAAFASPRAEGTLCVECLTVRVGPPVVVRGPFPDELDAPFNALKLADGTFRGFSANGTTFAIDGASLWDMAGERRAVLDAGAPGSINDCGRWLTSTLLSGGGLLGFVHQEQACDYENGRTHKSMALATSSDDGLSWTDLGTVIAGPDGPQPGKTTGEGDCTMLDGRDGYLYAYCLRNSDWQTIVARAPTSEPTRWRKYFEGAWSEPGVGGRATAIGFVGIGTGYLKEAGEVAAVATDPWFGGLRLSLSKNKVSFVDLKEPLLTIDGSDWERPAKTDLIAYPTILNPDDGSNAVDWNFLLAYIYVPPGKGFESRYLVFHDVSLARGDVPLAVQSGMALSRWAHPTQKAYVTSTGPLTGDRLAYRRDTVVAYMLTREPEEIASVKLAECFSNRAAHLDQILAEDGTCEGEGYTRDRTAGWLFAAEQAGTVPVYRCYDDAWGSHFASSAPDCEGLGTLQALLGYGLAP